MRGGRGSGVRKGEKDLKKKRGRQYEKRKERNGRRKTDEEERAGMK